MHTDVTERRIRMAIARRLRAFWDTDAEALSWLADRKFDGSSLVTDDLVIAVSKVIYRFGVEEDD